MLFPCAVFYRTTTRALSVPSPVQLVFLSLNDKRSNKYAQSCLPNKQGHLLLTWVTTSLLEIFITASFTPPLLSQPHPSPLSPRW